MSAPKFCFVISPLGDPGTPIRDRADFIRSTYLESACLIAGYRAVRSDDPENLHIQNGITAALNNAPMTIAYLGAPYCGVLSCGGAPFWNGNVMMEVGVRLSSGLPIVFVCDRGADGKLPSLPLRLTQTKINMLPPPASPLSRDAQRDRKNYADRVIEILKNRDWDATVRNSKIMSITFNPTAQAIEEYDRLVKSLKKIVALELKNDLKEAELVDIAVSGVDLDPAETIRTIAAQLKAAADATQFLPCKLPIAMINAANSKSGNPDNLIYSAASEAAEALFGIDGRPLVGRTLNEFYQSVKRRMHPVQWREFERDQAESRKLLKRKMGAGETASAKAQVPIVFDAPDDPFANRAYLPIIVQEFKGDRGAETSWYSIRVLYLDVTSVTKKEILPNGEEYYVCLLDHETDVDLEPLKAPVGPPVKVFISFTSRYETEANSLRDTLASLHPYIDPFISGTIVPGKNDIRALQKGWADSDISFVLLGEPPMGPGQTSEVDEIIRGLMSDRAEYPVVPVMLHPQAKLPQFMSREWTQLEKLTEGYLRSLLKSHFPRRLPLDWRSLTEDPAQR